MAGLFAFLLVAGAARGQAPVVSPEAPQSTPATAGAPDTPADLVLANRVVVTFRASYLHISPRGRAEGASARIHALIGRRGSVGAVGSREIPEGILITIGGEAFFGLTARDLDPLEDETLAQLRERTVANLTLALREFVESRSLSRLLGGLGRAAAATLLFVFLQWILRRTARWLTLLLERVTAGLVRRVNIGEFKLLTPEQAVVLVRRSIGALRLTAALVLAYAWAVYVLEQFPYTRPWGERLGSYLLAAAAGVLRSVVRAVPGILLVVLIFVAVRTLSRLLGAYLTAAEKGTLRVRWLHPDTIPATRRILTVVLWLFAVALAYPNLPGSRSAAFQGVSVIAGLMLTLGSSALVGQVLSGFMIIYSRSLRVGDYVRIGDHEGIVESIGFFTMVIRTNKREMVSIPNSVVVGTETKNYTLHADERGVILYTSVTIGYGTPWRQVHALLLMAADRTPGLKKEPPPFVDQTALSDFYVEYQLNAYIEDPKSRLPTLAALHANIQDTFNENCVQILSPHYEADPPERVYVPKEQWYEPPARPPEAPSTPEGPRPRADPPPASATESRRDRV